jgi:hypothetical protein
LMKQCMRRHWRSPIVLNQIEDFKCRPMNCFNKAHSKVVDIIGIKEKCGLSLLICCFNLKIIIGGYIPTHEHYRNNRTNSWGPWNPCEHPFPAIT